MHSHTCNMKIEKLFELKPREEIVKIVNESFVPHLPKFSFILLWLVAPFFFLFPLFRMGTIGVVLFFLLFGSGLFVAYRIFFCWTRTVFIITDRRIIDVEQGGFFDRVVTEAPFHKIDEASYRVKGFFPTMFRYGVVRLHLRGSAADIQFKHVLKPDQVHNLINDLREDHEKK